MYMLHSGLGQQKVTNATNAGHAALSAKRVVSE